MARKRIDRTFDNCGIMDVKCQTCGKAFVTSPQYVYFRRIGNKGRRIWFCKYTCMTAYDRKHGEKAKRKTSDTAMSNV